MRNLVIGLILGAFTSVCAQAVLTAHFQATEQADVEKCFAAASVENSKTAVSFNLGPDGVNYDSAVCWPDGIDIAK